MVSPNLQQDLEQACSEVYYPSSPADAQQRLQRWSDTGVETPSAIAVPINEDEIIALVRLATQHDLQIIAAGGGCAWFVPIDSEKIYLSLEKFKGITVDTSENTITVEGGVRTGEAMEACRQHDYYTFLPVLNSIGVIGSVIGGGFSSFNGIHGFAVDNVVSLTVITATCQKLTLTHQSQSDEAKLFSALLGAGQGLGIVTSLTMKAFPISSLGMTSNKIWTRKIVFPASEIACAADLFCAIKPNPRLSTSLMFTRPPNSPAPLAILSASFFGPAPDAEHAVTPLLSDHHPYTFSTETTYTNYHDINTPRNSIAHPRDQKEMYTCTIRTTTAASILTAFHHFTTFLTSTTTTTTTTPTKSYVFIGQWSPDLPTRLTPLQNFTAVRDRGTLVQAVAWYTDPATKPRADEFGTNVVRAMRARDDEAGLPPRILGHNFRFGVGVDEAYTREMRGAWWEVKRRWDPRNVVWGVLGDGDRVGGG